MDILGAIILIAFVVIIVLIGINFVRSQNINYRMGKGMFEKSEHCLDDKKEISDKEYYDGDGGLLK